MEKATLRPRNMMRNNEFVGELKEKSVLQKWPSLRARRPSLRSDKRLKGVVVAFAKDKHNFRENCGRMRGLKGIQCCLIR